MFTTCLRNFGLGLLLLLAPHDASPSRVIKIGIIDSGLPPNFNQFPICASKDFTETGIVDDVGHGTNITNTATKDLNKLRYCLVVAKVFSSKEIGTTMERLVAALIFMHKNGVQILNLSLGGLDGYDANERLAIKMLLNEPGVVVLAAAGNDGKNLDGNCNYFPACYDDRIISVGNGLSNLQHAATSNYGKYVKAWQDGQNVCGGGICQSGTSQATAKETNKVAKRMMQSTENDKQYEEAAWRTGEAVIKYNNVDENIKNFTDTYTQPLNKKLKIYLSNVPDKYQQATVVIYTVYETIIRQKVEISYGF